ncbi:cysteine proteinase, partial [Pluteus cervinus]
LQRPTELLNNVCLNGGARLLQELCRRSPNSAQHVDDCAVLTTYELPRIRFKASDEELWRQTRGSLYWTKNTWILPIHRAEPEAHWVCCVFQLQRRRLLLFDSLGSRGNWGNDIQVLYFDSMTLLARLTMIAQNRGMTMDVPHEGWSVYPVVTRPLQHNDYDCGVWVLAFVASVLRGFDHTGITEAGLSRLRYYLYCHVLQLPHTP